MQVGKAKKIEKNQNYILGIGSRSPNKIMPTFGRTRPVVRLCHETSIGLEVAPT